MILYKCREENKEMEIIISTYPEKLQSSPSIERIVKEAIVKVGELYGLETAEVSITLTDNVYIHELNMKYRNIDRPTDVLSFALNEGEEPEIVDGPVVNMLGDIIISVERATEQAAEYGHSIEREIAFLTVHGMLHLLGYDHMVKNEKEIMREKEEEILNNFNLKR